MLDMWVPGRPVRHIIGGSEVSGLSPGPAGRRAPRILPEPHLLRSLSAHSPHMARRARQTWLGFAVSGESGLEQRPPRVAPSVASSSHLQHSRPRRKGQAEVRCHVSRKTLPEPQSAWACSGLTEEGPLRGISVEEQGMNVPQDREEGAGRDTGAVRPTRDRETARFPVRLPSRFHSRFCRESGIPVWVRRCQPLTAARGW